MTFTIENIRSVLDGCIPKQHDCAFGNVVERAKQLLSGVDSDILEEQVSTLNWLIAHLDPERYDQPELDSSEVDLCEQDESRPSLIREYIAQIELDPEVPFSWSQYFGLMALGIISESMPLDYFAENHEFEYDSLRWVSDSMWLRAIEAMEAVSLGEAYQDVERKEAGIYGQVEKRIRLSHSRAAYKGHSQSKKKKIIQEFVKSYRPGELPSRAKAAQAYYENLPDDKRKLFSETNVVRTLLDALRAEEKRQRTRSKS
jgi:hypothetical protein